MQKNKEYPLFTVIIPHKNRVEYLIHTLKTCMIQDYPNFEIIVSDDCSEDSTVEMVESLIEKDQRIKLYAHKKHLGMRENFEFALNQVRKGYVMALGGDDGLAPNAIWRMYEIIQGTNCELLTWTPAGFTYPDIPGEKNIFYFKRKKNDGLKYVKSKDFLTKISNTFRYQIDECPMLFMKSVASTKLIDKVKSRTKDGSFYYCATPDGFSGVVLAGEVSEYVMTYEPLSIGGSTTKSQGRNYNRSDEKSRKEAEQFFKDNIDRNMHEVLASQPYSPLVTLMTADYLLSAKDLKGWKGEFPEISIKSLIDESFRLIEQGDFDSAVLIRELEILSKIAEYHNLSDYFNELISKTKRKVFLSNEIHGFLITSSVRIEGSSIGINNIYDASLALNSLYAIYNKITVKSFFAFLTRSISLLMRNKKVKRESLPQLK